MSYVQSVPMLIEPAAAGLQHVRAAAEFVNPTITFHGLGADSFQLVGNNNLRIGRDLLAADMVDIGTAITADGAYLIEEGTIWISIIRTGTADTSAQAYLAGLARVGAF